MQTDNNNLVHDQADAPVVADARARLVAALAECGPHALGYLGGGDFLVHLYGIDPQIDAAINAVEGPGREGGDG